MDGGDAAGLEGAPAIWTWRKWRTNSILGSQNIVCTLFFTPWIQSSNTVLGVRTMRTHDSSLLWYLNAPNHEQQDGRQSSQHRVARSLPVEKHHFTCTVSCFQIEKHPVIHVWWLDDNKDDCSWIWCYKWCCCFLGSLLPCVLFLPENVYFQFFFFSSIFMPSLREKGFDTTNRPQKDSEQPVHPLQNLSY